MTLKEEFFQIQSYEEFDAKRERFRQLKIDGEIKEHMDRIFPEVKLFKGDAIHPKKDEQ